MKIALAVCLSCMQFSLIAQRSCTGSAGCKACKNCRYCKHCNSGGTCGVCHPQNKKGTTHRVKKAVDFVVFNKEEPDEDYVNSYDVVVSDLEKHAFTHEMWPLIDKIVVLNKIDTNAKRTVRIYLYLKRNDGYYCYFEKKPNCESSIEY